MKRIAIIFTFIFLLFSCVSVNAKVIVIKGVSDAPTSDESCRACVVPFIDAVNSRLKGEVKIRWVGGPEVIQEAGLTDALKNGVIGIVLHQPRGRITPILSAGLAGDLTELDGLGERKSGAYDVWVEAYDKYLNARYLGLPHNQTGKYYVYLNKKNIKTLEGLKGLKIRVFGIYEPIVRAIGASPMSLPIGDVYTAMQRGVIDGLITNPPACKQYGLYEVTKAVISPGFLQMSAAMYMNKDVWNKLSKKAQDVVLEEARNAEIIGKREVTKLTDADYELAIKDGIKVIELSPEESDKFLTEVRNAAWEYAIANDNTGYVRKLKPLLQK